MSTTPAPDATVPLAHDLSGPDDAPLLVLLHGITEDRRAWDPLVPALAADHRVLRVDLRGHGESPRGASYDLGDYAGDVHPLVERLGGGDPLVVGHSLGGTVATAYAAAFPVRAVVNVDQSLDLAGLQAQLLAAAPALRGDGFEGAMYGLFDALRGGLGDPEFARLTDLRDPRQDVVLGTWSLLLDHSADEVAAAVDAMARAVTAPYVTLFGIDPGEGYDAWLRDRIPQARTEVWPGLGHYPHLAEPERFVAFLHDVEAGLPTGA